MTYHIYYNWDADVGECLETPPALGVPFGYEKVMTRQEPVDFSKYRLTRDLQVVPRDDGSTTYQKYRLRFYPSFGDQMDMLWHAMDGGQLPKVEPFYSEIKAVKDKFPKGWQPPEQSVGS